MRLFQNGSKTEKGGLHMIDLAVYIHPEEKVLADKIYHLVGINKILDTIVREKLDDVNRYIYSAASVRLTKTHKAVQYMEEGCKLFGVDIVPPVYLKRSYYADITCQGYNNPVVILPDVLVDNAPDDLLRGRMMAAAASIAAGHHKLELLIWFIDNFKGIITIPGIGTALDVLLYEWLRTQEYTLDRAFYVATEDQELSLKNILYGEIPDSILNNFHFGTNGTFEKQVEAFKKPIGTTGTVSKVLGYLQKETWIPERYSELKKYMYDSGLCGGYRR